MNRDMHTDPRDELRALTTRMRALLDDAHARYPDQVPALRPADAIVTGVEGAAPRTGGDAFQPRDTADEPVATSSNAAASTPSFLDEEGDENALPLEFATSTMGHILLGQSRPDEARAIFRAVLDRDPSDAEARRGLELLGESAAVSHAAEAPTESSVEMLDRAPPPEGYGALTVRALAVDPSTLAVYWEVPEADLDGTPLTLCVVSLKVGPRGDVERIERRVHGVARIGERFIYELAAGAEHHIAIGFTKDGAFAPLAHASAVRAPRGAESDRVARAQSAVSSDDASASNDSPEARAAATQVFDAARRAWMRQKPAAPSSTSLG